MEKEKLIAVAKIVAHKIRSQGYSKKELLDRMMAASPQTAISLRSLERILAEEAVARKSLVPVIEALDLDVEQVFVEAKTRITWLKGCQAQFLQQQSSILHLLSGDGFTPQSSSFLFPLELRRHHRPTRHPRTSSLLGVLEVAPPSKLTLTKFKRKILHPYAKQLQDPCRIVILGDTGSGKTMVLQDLGRWVFAGKRGIAILIPPSALAQGQSIQEYLFADWLKPITRKQTVSAADQQRLVDLFEQETIWLLLDGVDEIAVDSSALKQLAEQFKGILANANWIITCRPNIWELESNALREQFTQAYRLQPLDPGVGQNLSQVGAFIQDCLPKRLAQQLIEKLQMPKYAATRELATNPLLLTLLAYTCYRGDGELPDTKNRLYQKFIEYLYNRKPDHLIPDRFQQQELNQALGILAFRAIDETNSPYRLSSAFVYRVWREENLDPEDLSFLNQVGLLNESGVAQEIPDERVSKFLHPSMQEYFAVFAIARLFRSQPDQTLSTMIYWFLQKRWHGVFLFLMGSDQIDKHQKEALLQALIDRTNYANDYYYHCAVCLACESIAEFKESQLSKEILQQVIDWGVEGWNPDEKRNYLSISRSRMAAKALALSDSGQVVEYLSQQLHRFQSNGYWQYAVAARLGSIKSGKSLAVEILVQLLEHDEELVRDNGVHLLVELAPDHPALHHYLNACLTGSSRSDQLFAVEILPKIGLKSSAVEKLVHLYETTPSQQDREPIAHLLAQLMPDHPYAKARANLKKTVVPCPPSSQPVAEWLQQLEGGTQRESAQVIEQLCTWLFDLQNIEDLLLNNAQLIQVIRVLKQWLDPVSDFSNFESLRCHQALYYCAQVVPYSIFCQGWNSAEKP